MTLLMAGFAQAAATIYSLAEYQTVDPNGLFPATGSNNVDKFDVSGSANNVIAPFTTTAYIRSATTATPRVRLYMQFDLTGLTTEQITSATLEFNAYSLNDLNANALTLNVSQLTNDWDPAGTPNPVWNPATVTTIATGQSIVSGTETDLYNGGGTGAAVYRNTTSYSLNVASIVENWQAGGTNNGFLLDFASMDTLSNGLGLDVSSIKLTVIPEPGTYALLAGLTGLVFVMLRRRR